MRAVITQGCQLHRASVLVVCKPLSSHPSVWKQRFDSAARNFQKPEVSARATWFTSFWLCVCLRARLYRTLIYLLCRITPGIRSSMTWQSYRFLLFRGVRRFRQDLKEIWWLEKKIVNAVILLSFLHRLVQVLALCVVLWGQQKCSRVNIIQWFCINVHFTQSHKTTVLNVVVIHAVVSCQHAVAVLSFI